MSLSGFDIPLKDILFATNNFSDENLIREGGFGKIYKGQLLVSTKAFDIVARRLHPTNLEKLKEFLKEISVLSDLKHENLVTFIGYCSEKAERIIIYKYEDNSSLDIHLNNPTLTWTQRLKICVGVARALSYIYFDEGRNFSVILRNIKSSKILLDNNWEPKLSGFQHSMLKLAARRQGFLIAEFCGTYGYLDPEYEKTGGVTHKSDIFSFGVVLFEVLSGRRAVVPNENEELLSKLAKSCFEEGKLDDIMINPDQRKQMDLQSYKIFSETAYDCLKETRSDRPDIDQVLQRLEEALRLQQEYERERSTHIVEIEDYISQCTS